jgi:hypothetical protein
MPVVIGVKPEGECFLSLHKFCRVLLSFPFKKKKFKINKNFLKQFFIVYQCSLIIAYTSKLNKITQTLEKYLKG